LQLTETHAPPGRPELIGEWKLGLAVGAAKFAVCGHLHVAGTRAEAGPRQALALMRSWHDPLLALSGDRLPNQYSFAAPAISSKTPIVIATPKSNRMIGGMAAPVAAQFVILLRGRRSL
jgi:hypothetical protein